MGWKIPDDRHPLPNGQCLTLMVSGVVESATAVPPLTGYLSAYGEAPTVGTLAYRQEIGDIPSDISQYDVMIAVSDCGLVGKSGTLYTDIGALRAIVFDCAGNDGTPSWMEENSIVAEIDYYSWLRWPELVGSAAVLVMDN